MPERSFLESTEGAQLALRATARLRYKGATRMEHSAAKRTASTEDMQGRVRARPARRGYRA